MLDAGLIGSRIAARRKERGLTGEQLAEQVHVSPQAVSKWENGHSLPDTGVLPALAQALGMSIDALMLPRALRVVKAVYTDGQQAIDVTHAVDAQVNGRRLALTVGKDSLQAALDGDRLKLLLVTYEGPRGLRYDYTLERAPLYLDVDGPDGLEPSDFQIIGAYYGVGGNSRDVMRKMAHLDFFHWNEIHANHETFPSAPDTDGPEALTVIFINEAGIHAVSCAEGESLRYAADGRSLHRHDPSAAMLAGVPLLAWEQGMDCTWAGALHAALRVMGEAYTYEQLMGMSGACYRLAFTDVWDWSATDALVSYDFSTPLFTAIGYEQVWGDRVDKEERSAERRRIVADLDAGKPVLAINLRIAPEWGVICGYRDHGKTLLCRTYFDGPYLNARQEYLEADFWPFLIVHFGEKREKPSAVDTLRASLATLVAHWNAEPRRGYAQGKMAYAKWIEGLREEALWCAPQTPEDIERRLSVNDAQLLNLIDARRCAAAYLTQCAPLLEDAQCQAVLEIAGRYQRSYEALHAFRTARNGQDGERMKYNEVVVRKNTDADYRLRLADLLEAASADEAWIAQHVAQAGLALGHSCLT